MIHRPIICPLAGRGLAIFAVFCLLASGCGHGPATPKDDPANSGAKAAPVVQVGAAALGTIDKRLPTTGKLAVMRDQEASVSPVTAGVLDNLAVHYGQTVAKGQVIGHLSTQTLMGQIQQADATIGQETVQVQQAQVTAIQQRAQTRSAILQAQSTLANAMATLAGARATLTGYEAAVSNAEQALARQQSLFQDGVVAAKDVESAQLALQTARAQADAQRQTVDAQRQTVIGQRHAVDAARTGALQDLVKRKDIEVTQQQLRNARGALETSQAQLALYTLHSPLTGEVTAIGASTGEAVDATTKVATIVNRDILQLQIAVPAEHAHDVHPGQTVEFRVDGLPGRVFTTVIETVGAQVDPTTNAVTANASVRNPQHLLHDDAFARIDIILDRRRGVVVVPKSSVLVQADGSANVVVVDKDGVAHVKDVRPGVTEDDRTEILSGVSPGERVVTVGNYGLPENTHVAIAPAAGAGQSSGGEK